MPNWRGFQDFRFPVEADGLDDRHLSAANRPAVVEADGSLGESCPSPDMDGVGAKPETFHSMEVGKLPCTVDSLGGVGTPGYRGNL